MAIGHLMTMALLHKYFAQVDWETVDCNTKRSGVKIMAFVMRNAILDRRRRRELSTVFGNDDRVRKW